MHKYIVSPSTTEMIRDIPFDFPAVRQSSQCWRLLLTVWLLAGLVTSTQMKCTCWKDIHTARCVGCTRLPKNLPADVSRLNMTGNRVSNIQLPANVMSTLTDLRSVYLSNNIISALQSGDLCPLKRLMVLDLSANNLESVEENSIVCNDQMKRLILNDNPRLQLGALRSHSLEDLYLENCALTSFDHTLLSQLPALRGLYLRGNDDLPCAQVVQDIRRQLPHIKVHCDVKTTATKSTTTTNARHQPAANNHPNKPIFSQDSGYVPRFETGNVPSDILVSQTQDATPVKIQIVAPIPIVPLVVLLVILLIILLAVALVPVISRCYRKPGHHIRSSNECGGRELLQEPC